MDIQLFQKSEESTTYAVLLKVSVFSKGQFVGFFPEEVIPHDAGILLIHLPVQEPLLRLQERDTSTADSD